MKNLFCTKFFLAILLLALIAPLSSANGITINYGESGWNTETVVIRFENVPSGEKVTACVFADDGCDIRRSVVSASAGPDGVVVVIMPRDNDAFEAGDKVRGVCLADASNVCAELEAGGALIGGDCGTICEHCPEYYSGKITTATFEDLGSNQSEYTVAGTAEGFGNNYHVDVTILDKSGGLIDLQQVVVSNGSGNWEIVWTAASGGFKAVACYIDDTGMYETLAQCDLEVSAYIKHVSERAPSLTQWGMIVLVLMLLSAGVVIIRRRRVISAA